MGGNRLNNAQIWQEYTLGKQTYKQLAEKYNCSIKTIQRRIDSHQVYNKLPEPRHVIVLMDTTYWGRNFGVMLFKDAITKENLLKYYVKNETNALYIQGIKELELKGFKILAIVCDGRKGLVVDLMKQTDKESFEGALGLWQKKWNSFLNERTINPLTKKTFFTHKRLRSAYRSLFKNLPWLFTWYDHYTLRIPNTTNAIDGHFADLKNKLRNHNGLSLSRKKKFIDGFLKV